MTKFSLKYTRINDRCPNCGRRLLSTAFVEQWCEDCEWEYNRKNFYTIVTFPEANLNFKGGRSKIDDIEDLDKELLVFPVELNELDMPIEYTDEKLIIKKDLYDKLTPMAKKLIKLVLEMRDEFLDVFEAQEDNISYNLCIRIIRTYLGHTVGYKEANKVLNELKEFVKTF